jgi:rod shape-determining protein MreD
MRRLLTLFVCSLVLWAIVSQLNHALSDFHIYIFTGALFVTFSALTQPLGPGLGVSLLTGFVFDANTPVAFGTHVILFSLVHMMIHRLRDRVPRNDTVGRVTTAVLANLALFLLFSFIQLIRLPMLPGLWPRLIVDLVCSQIFIALIGPWFFALQARALVLVGSERSTFA